MAKTLYYECVMCGRELLYRGCWLKDGVQLCCRHALKLRGIHCNSCNGKGDGKCAALLRSDVIRQRKEELVATVLALPGLHLP